MQHKLTTILAVIVIIGTFSIGITHAQENNLVARLRVEDAGVEVFRINTAEWTAVRYETLVGVGDKVRTTAKGRAVLLVNDDLPNVILDPGTEIKIERLETTGARRPLLQVQALLGTASFVGVKAQLPEQSPLIVITPGFRADLLSADADIRIEPNGRSSLLVWTGSTQVTAGQGQPVTVKRGEGVRSPTAGPLSDVVPASTFAVLDSMLDGCPGRVEIFGDYQLNVRLGPGTQHPRIGSLANGSLVTAMGISTTTDNWFRVRYKGGFGWIQIISLFTGDCVVRPYPPSTGPENRTLFSDLTETFPQPSTK